MLKDTELGKDLWGEAIATHIYICNRCPSSILPNGITPYKLVFGHMPSIGHFRVFRSRCFIKILDETQSKFDDKVKECHLIKFEGDSLYVVVDAGKKKLCSHNVIFIEGPSKRGDSDEPSVIEFLKQVLEQEIAHIEDATDSFEL